MKFVALIFSLMTLSILISTSNNAVLVENRTIIADDNRKVFLPVVTKHDIERDALMALFNSTNGPGWKYNTGWGIGDPCDPAWYGLTCDSGHVQRLDLSGFQLSGPIPAELGNLSSLEGLDLASNPDLKCWETEEALSWALSLEYCTPYNCEPAYVGPTEACQQSQVIPNGWTVRVQGWHRIIN